jgi:hypothetical protein
VTREEEGEKAVTPGTVAEVAVMAEESVEAW